MAFPLFDRVWLIQQGLDMVFVSIGDYIEILCSALTFLNPSAASGLLGMAVSSA